MAFVADELITSVSIGGMKKRSHYRSLHLKSYNELPWSRTLAYASIVKMVSFYLYVPYVCTEKLILWDWAHGLILFTYVVCFSVYQIHIKLFSWSLILSSLTLWQLNNHLCWLNSTNIFVVNRFHCIQYGNYHHINLLKPTGHVMHQQFNIQQLYVLSTLCLCVLYLSENKQRLVPLTA